MQRHRLELKYEIVAESAVQPEMLVLVAAEDIDQPAQQRKHARLAAALLFGKALGAVGDFAVEAIVEPVEPTQRQRRQGGGQRRQQHPAASVQRLDREGPAARRNDQRRIDKTHIPAGVAAGKLEARREQHPAPRIERPRQGIVGGFIGVLANFAGDRDTPFGRIAQEWHA